MRIVLLGYMGSGKSTIGKELANKIQYKFVDLDHYIEIKENKSVSEIFAEKGEIYFRKIETKYLKALFNHHHDIVIALGGGTPCYGGNMDWLLQQSRTFSIYLKSSLQSLTGRLFNEREQRPLIQHINDKEIMQEFIAKHLFERSVQYNRASLILSTDNKSVEQISHDILKSINLL